MPVPSLDLSRICIVCILLHPYASAMRGRDISDKENERH